MFVMPRNYATQNFIVVNRPVEAMAVDEKMAMELAMEGPLSKWTNLMNGWQYRWFVLDENMGLLSYYTSKEKRIRGERRGCVRLQGAVIGIDDEDDSTFTITVDRKTFHFQARDADEKEQWIKVLENTIEKNARPKAALPRSTPGLQVVDFDKKLAEADAYLTILIEQVQAFQKRIDDCENEAERNTYNEIKDKAEVMIESVKKSIVLLQFSKHLVKEMLDLPQHKQFGVDGLVQPVRAPSRPTEADKPTATANQGSLGLPVMGGLGGASSSSSICRSADCLAVEPEPSESNDTVVAAGSGHASLSTSLPNLTTPTDEFMDVLSSPLASSPSLVVDGLEKRNLSNSSAMKHITDANDGIPDLSYSTSEDEDYFDAEEGIRDVHSLSVDTQNSRTSPKVISPNNDYFDELYDEDDEDNLESMENHGSLITHLLSQLRIGMDLTKVVLPTFILEKRSLLEMYSDFFAHPDLFVDIADQKTPRDRMIQTVRWYLSAFHAGRKTGVAKKPYNPIMGEVFRCYYDLPGMPASEDLVTDGPVPWCSRNNVSFISEQVSHHPPISAFYAECHNKHISLNGYIWTKSKFLGLSIGVHMIGQAVISVLDHEEEYILTFPNGYGRSILTVPWMELGGNINISCPKTGYSAQIEFHTKPFYGGKKDLITADLFGPTEKKSFCTIKGEWNGTMWARHVQGLTQNEVFVDTKNMAIVKKQVKPIDQQWKFESRRLWRDVTYNLKQRNIEKATEHKYQLEQQQREEAKQRKDTGTIYETRFFHEVGEHWVYDEPLVKRLSSKTDVQPLDV